MKCLIVDDEVFCREFVATLLRTTADCQQANNGTDALVKFKSALEGSDPFDLVIMDIMMPGMSGQDAAIAIRGIEREFKVEQKVNIIMLTALNSADEAMESFCNAQSAAYLVKPVSKDGLFNVLVNLGLYKR